MCCEPYLESEYGADYMSETPVKLLDRLLYGQRHHIDEEVRLDSKWLPGTVQRAWKVFADLHGWGVDEEWVCTV